MNFPSEILNIEHVLFSQYGDLKWWPANTPDEVLIGAILTQNTSWKNVEKAIDNLASEHLLDLRSLSNASREKISTLIKPSGFYNQKTERLLGISRKIYSEFGSLHNLSSQGLQFCIDYLGKMKGIGRETMDSILLYAMDFPRFVIDKYTIRFMTRYGLFQNSIDIEKLESIPGILKHDIQRLKNFHALIVELSKNFCRSEPLCKNCILNKNCKYYKDKSVP